jgi:hypothetical protein
MTQEAPALSQILQSYIDGFGRLGFPALMERFVVRNGSFTTGVALPSDFKKGRMKECFSNAAQLLDNHDGLTYMEGYGMTPGVPLPVHHAWCVNSKGEVIDTTWRDPAQCQYIGVAFTQEELWEQLDLHGVYGILDTGRGINTDLIFRRDPQLEALVSEFMPSRKRQNTVGGMSL